MWLVGYGYDQAGDVTSLTHPAGYTITNSINEAQQITQVSSTRNDSTHPGILAQNITYKPWGALWTLTDGCAPAGSCAQAQETYSYNSRMQLTGIQVQNTSNQSNYYSLTYNYTYPGGQLPGCSAPSQGTGNNGNVMGYTYTDGVNSNLSHTAVYAYDGVNRLACSNATGILAYNLDYSYDAFGNMSCVINQYTNGNCTASTFNNSANRIDQYSYDPAGDVTGDPFNNYGWDAEGRMATVDGGSSEIASYNALGQQVRLNYPGDGYSLDQLYDLSGHWLGMYALGAWNLGGTFWLGDRSFGWYSDFANTTYFAHRNLLQSSQITTDQTGNAAGDVLFYPWGINILGGDPSGFSDFTYEDDADWLLHTQNRQYTTSGGRWMSPDPAGLGAADLTNPQSLNLYAYRLNNPTSLTDPLGLFEHTPTDCSACPSGPQLAMIMNVGGCSTFVSIFDECSDTWAYTGPGGPAASSTNSQTATCSLTFGRTTAPGPDQATGTGAFGFAPPNGSVAIDPWALGLFAGPQTNALLGANASQITFSFNPTPKLPQGFPTTLTLGSIVGPKSERAGGSQFNGLYVFDIFRLPSLAAAYAATSPPGVPVAVTVTYPSSLPSNSGGPIADPPLGGPIPAAPGPVPASRGGSQW
jgi:RHS repeat-associated protein